MKDRYKFLIVISIFVAAYFIPFGDERVRKAILEAFYMIQDYAQKHVLLCLVPAFFIAGAITVFVSQASVMKYLGPLANKFLAYSVASVSGTILAVCSCTVLPALCRHLPDGGRDRTCDSLSLFRTCDQYSCHCSFRQGPGLADRACKGGWFRGFCIRDRPHRWHLFSKTMKQRK